MTYLNEISEQSNGLGSHIQVKFVPKEINPPNVPQPRPCKNFCVCLAQKVCDRCWEANTEQLLSRRVECKMKEFDTSFVESLLEVVKAKIRYR